MWHEILLTKLSSIVFYLAPLFWMSYFLSKRIISVPVDGVLFQPISADPKGSMLGPTLSLLFNDDRLTSSFTISPLIPIFIALFPTQLPAKPLTKSIGISMFSLHHLLPMPDDYLSGVLPTMSASTLLSVSLKHLPYSSRLNFD